MVARRSSFLGAGRAPAENPCITAGLGLKLHRGWGAVRPGGFWPALPRAA